MHQNLRLSQTKSLPWIHMGKPSEMDSSAYVLEDPIPPKKHCKPKSCVNEHGDLEVLALSEAYSTSTTTPSFFALVWLATLLNVLTVLKHHRLTYANKRDYFEKTNWITS